MALFYLQLLPIRPLRTFFGSTDDAKCPIWVKLIWPVAALAACDEIREFGF